jgi:hypothetical protein
MRHRIRICQPFVYVGTEDAEFRGQTGIILEVLSPCELLVAFELPDGRRPVAQVAPGDVGVTEEEAERFLRPRRFSPPAVTR